MDADRGNTKWKDLWEERGRAVRAVLGQTAPPDSVVPFSWGEHGLPGACVMIFPPQPSRKDYSYMTLGLTQPRPGSSVCYPWEFCIRTTEYAEWPVDLLKQLVTQWLCEQGDMGFGYQLPLLFFRDANDNLWGGLTDELPSLRITGAIRSMYLWRDEQNLEFVVSRNIFRLLTVVAVTHEEELLAQEATPAHLMALLNKLGVNQICDPFRAAITTRPEAAQTWEQLRHVSHDDVLRELLESRPGTRHTGQHA